jgi:hypothetical protein
VPPWLGGPHAARGQLGQAGGGAWP